MKKIKQGNKKIYFFIKRLFDLAVSIIGFILLLIIIPIIKLAFILTGDHDTIFYSQERIGKNEKIFKLYKFRTMVMNADKLLDDISNNPEYKDEWEKNQKLKKDPRVTKIGKFLRNSCLDETPQFINVLKGDMTIIGPRPYLIREKKYLKSNLKKIVIVKPGITGYWQVNREKNESFYSRMKLEKFYSKNCNLLLDLEIFFGTLLLFMKKFLKHIKIK